MIRSVRPIRHEYVYRCVILVVILRLVYSLGVIVEEISDEFVMRGPLGAFSFFFSLRISILPPS